MRKIYFGVAILLGSLAMAQTTGKVGINTEAPTATLEIKPNTANAADAATTKEGILIPRVSRLRAANMGADVTESTMVYISDVSNGAASGTTADVDAKGFYYFDGTKWVKMNAGGSGTTEVTFARNIRIEPSATITITNTDFFIHSTSSANVSTVLPAASSSKGRVICIYAESGTVNTGALGNAGNIYAGYGGCIISNGTQWITMSSL